MKTLKELEARVKINHCDEKVNVCYSKDVKEAVLKNNVAYKNLEFEIMEIFHKEAFSNAELLDVFEKYRNKKKRIFGDWKK